ncbi:unnamed protein product [Clonostachys rhizophaga]|uniref:Siderophore iron transporter mirB n=1 Tax=Clonostachys rhizophaga TaxID=160324 RepID=A0A9N9V0R7_9HYPO|nr:unnamed protein product [Clonostachys rhizophaga]
MGVTEIDRNQHAAAAVDAGSEHDTEKREQLAAGLDDSDGSEVKQEGVAQVEAITTVWSTRMLWTAFVFLYLVSFVDALLQSVQGALTPYVTSSFSQHSLLATTSIVANIVGGVCQLTIAKIIDIWGRVEGFTIMIFLVVLGMILKATCTSVEMYAAAQTIYWVGHIGVGYIISVVLADMTTLQNRMIMFGINQTPIIASVFAGPVIAQLFYDEVNFRWAFGAFTIIMVVFAIPIVIIFWLNQRKALKLGVIKKEKSGRTWWQSTEHYFWEFDAVGLLLTTAGWSLLLLPFSIASIAPDGWSSGYIIAMIVLGVVLLVAFGLWEKYFARVPYFPWKYLKDRTVLGSCFLYGFMFLSIFVWDAYYSTYLQVVHDESITISNYVLNCLSLASAFIAPFVGLLIRYTNEYKWTSITGIPFMTLGTALLIHFRRPETEVGYLVMCQLFNGIGSGIWALTAEIAIMSSVKHQEVAVAVAMWGLFGSIGAAVGNTIAGALWTNIVPEKLTAELPEGSKDLMAEIYGDITVQLSYPMGSPIRDAIIAAFDDVQRKMVIVGSCFLPLMLISILVWKNKNLRSRQQEQGQSKGNIF